MKNFKQGRSQGGFSLIELLLVLAIIAALAVAAFIVYPRVQAGRNATFESQLLSSAQAGVKALFTTGNYDRINLAAAYNAEIFPSNMNISVGSIQNQWEGAVTVLPSSSSGANGTAIGTPDRYFKIGYTNVPTDVCIRLAGAAVQNFGTVLVGTSATVAPSAVADIVQDTYSTTQVPLDEGKIAANCRGTGGRASITFVSN